MNTSIGRWVLHHELEEPPKSSQEEVSIAHLHWITAERFIRLLVVYVDHGVRYDIVSPRQPGLTSNGRRFKDLRCQDLEMFAGQTVRQANVSFAFRCHSIPSNNAYRSVAFVCINSANADVSIDGKRLAIANPLSGFGIYTLHSGDLVRAFGHEVGHKRATPVKFIEFGKAIVGGSTVGEVNVWDIETGRKVQTITHTGTHTSYSPVPCSTDQLTGSDHRLILSLDVGGWLPPKSARTDKSISGPVRPH